MLENIFYWLMWQGGIKTKYFDPIVGEGYFSGNKGDLVKFTSKEIIPVFNKEGRVIYHKSVNSPYPFILYLNIYNGADSIYIEKILERKGRTFLDIKRKIW